MGVALLAELMELNKQYRYGLMKTWTSSAAFDMNGKKMCDVCGIFINKVWQALIGSSFHRPVTNSSVSASTKLTSFSAVSDVW